MTDREKHDCPQPYSSVWKNQLSVKGTLDQSFHRLAHFWVSAKGTLSNVNLYVSYGHVCVCVCVCRCRWGTGLKAIATAQTGWELIFIRNRMHSELDKMKNFIQHFSERSHTRSPGSASRATNATEATQTVYMHTQHAIFNIPPMTRMDLLHSVGSHNIYYISFPNKPQSQHFIFPHVIIIR